MTSASRVWALAIALSFALSAPLFAETAEEKLARLPEGYVAPEDMPDSLILVPPPPSPGSAAQALDTDIAASKEALQDTARFDLARRDANLEFPEVTNAFACALGARITAEDMPRLQQLMLRALVDAGSSTYRAKNAYDRSRPFTQNGNAICTPDQKEFLRNDGSYPSGHTAIGWAWAMILAEIAPERATALLECPL